MIMRKQESYPAPSTAFMMLRNMPPSALAHKKVALYTCRYIFNPVDGYLDLFFTKKMHLGCFSIYKALL